jgi:hypothetical protein
LGPTACAALSCGRHHDRVDHRRTGEGGDGFARESAEVFADRLDVDQLENRTLTPGAATPPLTEQTAGTVISNPR